ncbi:MAG: hypothetical protein ACM3Q1_15290 [Bacteroidales bacterium]
MQFCRALLARCLVTATLSLTALPALAAAGHWQTQADNVAQAVDAAEAAFAKGDPETAKRLVSEAYFSSFEDSKLEAAIRKHVGAKRAAEIEKSFANLRKAIAAKDGAKVKAIAQGLRTDIAAEAKTLDEAKVAPGVFEVNQ